MVQCVKRTRVNRGLAMDEANARGAAVILHRPAVDADAAPLTDLFLQAMLGAVPGLPLAHTRDEIVEWMRTKPIRERNVTVAMADQRHVGFITVAEGWVHQLFIHPDYQRAGIGAGLLLPVLSSAVTPVRLWAFQRNAIARAFYERRGFSAELFTDGSGNEERTPDVLYVWRPL
jgi:GNAT superfamily N-acetyltransferase